MHSSSTHQNQATFELVAIVSDLEMFIKPTRDALPVTTLEVVISPFTLALQFDQLRYEESILMVVPESPGLLLDVLGKWGLGGFLVGHIETGWTGWHVREIGPISGMRFWLPNATFS